MLGRLLVAAKRKLTFEIDDEGNLSKRGTLGKYLPNELGFHGNISPERRKTVHMHLHNIVQARFSDPQLATGNSPNRRLGSYE